MNNGRVNVETLKEDKVLLSISNQAINWQSHILESLLKEWVHQSVHPHL